MKAARWVRRRRIEIVDIPEPVPGDGEVKVKIAWCGICATDLHEYLHGPIFLFQEEHPPAPITLGHEFGGFVEEIGTGVTGFNEGDPVTIFPLSGCGECEHCKNDRERLCEKIGFYGLSTDGGFAEYIVVNSRNLYKLPGVPSEYLAFGEPVAAAVHAVNKGGIKEGDYVAVIGAGPIGLLVGQVAMTKGAEVIVSEILSRRRMKAGEFGFKAVLDPFSPDYIDTVRDLTEGYGVHVAIDCAGSFTPLEEMANPLSQAISITRAGGRIVVVGIHDFPVPLPVNDFLEGEIELVSSWAFSRKDFEEGIYLLQNEKLQIGKMITARIYIDDLVSKGFLELELKKDYHIKILVTPHEEILEKADSEKDSLAS